MNILFKSVKIVDPNSPYNHKEADILIEGGIIRQIKSGIKSEKQVKIVEGENLYISPGWVDMQASFGDPGFEHKEDLVSGSKAAAAGGFTTVVVMPSTNPPLHTKSDIEYVINKSKSLSGSVEIIPAGTLSHNRDGKDIAEMYDMHLSGAIAFTDDKRPIADAGLLTRALQYSKTFNGLIITHCDDKSLSHDGKANEGAASTMLGLKGMPALAEELMVSRNIQLADYCGARLHITSVSSARSVEHIRKAKAKGLKITAAVNAHHLAFDENTLKEFDTNYKVNPPLRTKVDIEALRKGLADGTIDVIVSDHRPEDIESKQVEFDHASFGMEGIETAFALANTNRGKITLEEFIQKLSVNPRAILGLPSATIKEGEVACLTVFDPEKIWAISANDIRSKSKNTPLIGQRLQGKPVAIYNRKTLTVIE